MESILQRFGLGASKAWIAGLNGVPATWLIVGLIPAEITAALSAALPIEWVVVHAGLSVIGGIAMFFAAWYATYHPAPPGA